jgi:CubicO group peptidase (beta-lactamase class C family)
MTTSSDASVLSRREMLGLASGALGLSLLPSSFLANTFQTAAPAFNPNPKLPDPKRSLPRTVALLEKLQQNKVQIGSQFYLSRHGKPLADFALGQARAGVPMTTDTLMIWFSSTKAITAVAVAQQWERGKLDLDDPVAKYIPEFGNRGKEAITIRHVLTHRGGFRFADGRNAALTRSMEENLKLIYQAELESGWAPGQKAGYHPTSSWFILGELVQRLGKRPFPRYVREEIFVPLGMQDCWVGMPAERWRAYGQRIGFMHATAGGNTQPTPVPNSEQFNTNCLPGANGRGPVRELGRFYEMLLNRGQLNGKRILSPQTVEAITARQRTGMRDETFGITIDWGLGFIVDAFLYGSHCSDRAFGHAGAQSSVGFCDPEYGLVVALVLNGMPGPKPHNQRMLDLANAIYLDLGLAREGAPGKQRELPVIG